MFLSFYFPSHELFHYFCFISFYVIISLLFVSFLLHLLLCSMAFIWKYSSTAYTKKILVCFSFVYSNHLSQLLLVISLLFPIFQLEVAISPYGQMSCRRIVTFPSAGAVPFRPTTFVGGALLVWIWKIYGINKFLSKASRLTVLVW